LQGIVNAYVVSNFVGLLNQIKLWNNALESFELILAYLEQLFNDVLNSARHISFVQDCSEPVKDCITASWGNFLQNLAYLLHEFGCHFNAIFCGLSQKKTQNLECNQLMHHILIYQVCQHLQASFAQKLVLTSVGFLELVNYSVK
jgi:hypothetical protein